MGYTSRSDPMCIAYWMSFVGPCEAQGRARSLTDKMPEQWLAGCETYLGAGKR
ncbi:hypothetical protein FHY04_003866 [Sphingomonas sp. BK481]|nr:hypothetical protein [Sphingomonas sp. BK481]